MTGLFGFFRTTPVQPEDNHILLQRMFQALSQPKGGILHLHVDQWVGIGGLTNPVFPESGQLFTDPEKRYYLCLIGEVENATEIVAKSIALSDNPSCPARSLGPALMLLLQQEGPEAVSTIRGSFTLCFYDTQTQTLHLMTCRHGAYYLYWTRTMHGLVFASALRSLLAFPGVKKRVNRAAIANLFTFEFLLGNQTLFEDIHLLPQATILTQRKERSTQQTYWDYPASPVQETPPFPEVVQAGSAIIRRTIHRYAHTHPQLGIPLSGGLDSRTLLCYTSEVRAGVPVYHLQKHPAETAIARQVCHALGARWHTMDHRDFDPQETIPAGMQIGEGQVSIHQYWLLPYMQKISREQPVSYLLDGYLVDVLLGSLWLVLPQKPQYSSTEKIQQIFRLWRMFPLFLGRWLFTRDFFELLASQPLAEVKSVLQHRLDADITDVVRYFALLNRGRRYTLAFTNLNRYYVPIGTPALDYEFVEFCLSVPPVYRESSRLHRAILLRDFPHLASIPWIKTGLPLDQDFTPFLLRRKILRKYGRYAISLLSGGWVEKKPDYDHNYRFRHDERFRQYYLRILRDPRTASRGILDRKGIERLISLQLHGMNQFNLIDALITIELWYRAYID